MTILATYQQVCAQHYAPYPVVFTRAQDVHLWDDTGKQYLDCMSMYSAVNLGHCRPELIKTLAQQAQTLHLSSNAFHNDQMPPFIAQACALTGLQKGLAMNTGAEAVETALKLAKKWAYTRKGVSPNQAEIIACQGNFHGRTTAIIGLSGEPQYRDLFGPYPPGLATIPYGDLAALEQAITPNTAAFLVEAIQGEGGIIIPPEGYLAACQALCQRHNVLLIIDEIQTGLGRTGALLACSSANIQPDLLLLGKSLSGGLLPVSLCLGTADVIDVFIPGDHGSTFAGNPLACAVARRALTLLEEDDLCARAATQGKTLLAELHALNHPLIKAIRGRGLMIGLEIDTQHCELRTLCQTLLDFGLVSKDTHHTVLRITPPLTLQNHHIDQLITGLQQALDRCQP